MLEEAEKFVVSTTLGEPLPWKNSRLLSGDGAEAVAALKAEEGPDLLVMGSGVLVQSLQRRGLVDRFMLMIHPLVLGEGRRLFAEEGAFADLRLVGLRHHDHRSHHRHLRTQVTLRGPAPRMTRRRDLPRPGPPGATLWTRLKGEARMGTSDAPRGMGAAGWLALAAVLLAVVAGLWLAFYPAYQGESETVSSSGIATSSESSTLIDENGAWAAFLLCVPVILAGLGLWGALRRRRTLLWIFAGVLLAFVVLGGFSIGLFFFPAALALLLAAGLTEGRGGRERKSRR